MIAQDARLIGAGLGVSASVEIIPPHGQGMDHRHHETARGLGVEIRPAKPDDIPLILQLIRELAAYEREPEQAIATPQDMHRALFAERPLAECVIGLIDSEPQGFALFFHNFSTWTGKPGIYLEDLFVRPESRGRGLGKALLIRLAGLAVDRGCTRFEWNVLDWNTPALEFYRAMGARAMTDWTIHRVSGEALVKLAKLDRSSLDKP